MYKDFNDIKIEQLKEQNSQLDKTIMFLKMM